LCFSFHFSFVVVAAFAPHIWNELSTMTGAAHTSAVPKTKPPLQQTCVERDIIFACGIFTFPARQQGREIVLF
jgi:hypothetical protein